ncbi:hypothetical protein CLAFUW4_12824 [Fulvia fulva]|uniref:Uncharacterized protein n=1 Tax=Passalora fulva TaxID=5499 RepID=A0A9Q8PJM4_PASFU|nr:uncharacterized protein CLAFUR5_12691 [Fulvia fulva]KAK4611911.1 hypothetical protein CLAFUR4_12828 [Fulvia fulva]KAK4612841.1 hypothetical protein CLAFUR0_12834 [Fulvia fulva]UJO23751.1 hypothetical protein CLAFUR5_12691 [Fulvia fulva]WPV21248.1 hypothetical protein CLAFUW4_12824 [Fulvia fulva]WPV36398.1 hypothetical protein CLAFUW7_12832 [Fulvia fulva]
MAFHLLTQLLLVLLMITSYQVNANWSLTFYPTLEQCKGEDPVRNHYYTFTGDESLWSGNASLRGECFVPGGDRIDTNMICAETLDGGITMQQCGPSIMSHLKDWFWSVTPGSACSWGHIRAAGICQDYMSEPKDTSECYSGEHEMKVQGHSSMSMHFSCRCSGTSDTCKPSSFED